MIHRRERLFCLCMLLSAWSAVAVLADPTVCSPTTERYDLAPATRWATPCIIIDSGVEGPVVMITAGMHGDEPAGALAADQIADWPILRGKLIVVPRCNVPGLAERSRNMPGTPEGQRNLNRNFPSNTDDDAPRGQPAQAIWNVAVEHIPDVLIDLHEGYGFRAAGSKSVGSSVIRTGHPGAKALQKLMLDAVNAEIEEDDRRFVALRSPVVGSFAAATWKKLGACSFICETTTKDQPLALRVRQHRLMVHAVLSHLGMIDVPAHRLTPLRRDDDKRIFLARYNGPGAGYNNTPDHYERILAGDERFVVRRIGPAEVEEGVLEQFDVVIFPGGSGSGQARGIGEAGRQRVVRFVEEGGGYIGICAGAYLATAHYKWSLGLIDSTSLDTKHWRRGRGTVQLELTDGGRALFGEPDAEADIHFAQGPLLAPAGRDDIPDYEVLAWYRSGVGKNGADPATMVDTPAIVRNAFGRGRVVVFSPHPEQTKGLNAWLTRSLHWAAGIEVESAALRPVTTGSLPAAQ